MKETPLLFKPEMVKASLADIKTQTRRIVKIQPMEVGAVKFTQHWEQRDHWYFTSNSGRCGIFDPQFIKCPYGVPGDHLWVKETFAVASCYDHLKPSQLGFLLEKNIEYQATDDFLDDVRGRIRQSIFMPKRFSRITLEITDIRLEQLQNITSDECLKEGVDDSLVRKWGPEAAFQYLWDSINPLYPWWHNPWVWVITFRRLCQ